MAAVPVETMGVGVQKDAVRHQQLQQEQSGEMARQAAEVADLASIKRQLAESQVSPYTSLFLPPLSLQFIRRYYINRFHSGCLEAQQLMWPCKQHDAAEQHLV